MLDFKQELVKPTTVVTIASCMNLVLLCKEGENGTLHVDVHNFINIQLKLMVGDFSNLTDHCESLQECSRFAGTAAMEVGPGSNQLSPLPTRPIEPARPILIEPSESRQASNDEHEDYCQCLMC